MKSLLVLVAVLVPSLASAEKKLTKSAGETWDCATDGVVTIAVNKGTFGLLGECKRVTVTGNKNAVSIASSASVVIGGADNFVDVDEVGGISTSGARNHVTWKKAKTGDKPKITKGGRDNRVVAKK